MRNIFLILFVLIWCTFSWDITISSSEGVSEIKVSFTNDSPQKSSILKWRSPFDDLEGLYSFVVTKDGKKMEYMGPIALRLSPNKEDFLEFGPGDTLTTIVNLTNGFEFPDVGIYEIQLVILTESHTVLKSNVIDVHVTTISKINVHSPDLADISFLNCNTEHRNIITPAWGEFGVAAGMMRTAVADNPQSSQLYRTWFGAYDSTRYGTVSRCINNLYADFNANGKEFYCNPSGCSPGVVAYVSSGSPNTIHVCQLYFQLSNRDHIFVIVHEEMHFGAICGAPDYVYGRQGSMNLAISNPNNAVRNSDNYRFYGEDLYYAN